MKRGLLSLSLLALFAGLLLFSYSGGMPEQFPAPDFALKDIFTGREVKFSDLKGRPLVLYYFASW